VTLLPGDHRLATRRFPDPTGTDEGVPDGALRPMTPAPTLMRENVKNGPNPSAAPTCARSSQVEVDDAEIRIHGRKSVLWNVW
jgi:hypothetical protein